MSKTARLFKDSGKVVSTLSGWWRPAKDSTAPPAGDPLRKGVGGKTDLAVIDLECDLSHGEGTEEEEEKKQDLGTFAVNACRLDWIHTEPNKSAKSLQLSAARASTHNLSQGNGCTRERGFACLVRCATVLLKGGDEEPGRKLRAFSGYWCKHSCPVTERAVLDPGFTAYFGFVRVLPEILQHRLTYDECVRAAANRNKQVAHCETSLDVSFNSSSCTVLLIAEQSRTVLAEQLKLQRLDECAHNADRTYPTTDPFRLFSSLCNCSPGD
ncbi:hypothetical protein Bbelb_209360 [Branchiostoma belcheri]|nr:hypothetical protein Bbelb_209360 [Branchiostoma belcheri]